MVWLQEVLTLAPRPRGFHLVTREILAGIPGLDEVSVGILHLLIQHTSASLTLNENASPDVRRDFETWFNLVVPEGGRGGTGSAGGGGGSAASGLWTHTLEGDDDMPAHVKASLLGPSLTLPVSAGRLALGVWQGIYLCEHRDHGGPRSIVATVWGSSVAG